MTEYLGVWCPTCKQDCLPLRSGRCGFCDTRVIDPDEPSTSIETDLVAQLPPRQEERVDTCKIDGCTRASAGKGGPWARMCQTHISEEVARRQAKRHGTERPAAAEPAPAHANGNGEAPPGSLATLAARVDTARLELDRAREQHKAAVTELREALEVA